MSTTKNHKGKLTKHISKNDRQESTILPLHNQTMTGCIDPRLDVSIRFIVGHLGYWKLGGGGIIVKR